MITGAPPAVRFGLDGGLAPLWVERLVADTTACRCPVPIGRLQQGEEVLPDTRQMVGSAELFHRHIVAAAINITR